MRLCACRKGVFLLRKVIFGCEIACERTVPFPQAIEVGDAFCTDNLAIVAGVTMTACSGISAPLDLKVKQCSG